MLNVGVQGLPSHEIASKLIVGAGTACANCIGTWQYGAVHVGSCPCGPLQACVLIILRLIFARVFLRWLPRKRAQARACAPIRPCPCSGAQHAAPDCGSRAARNPICLAQSPFRQSRGPARGLGIWRANLSGTAARMHLLATSYRLRGGEAGQWWHRFFEGFAWPGTRTMQPSCRSGTGPGEPRPQILTRETGQIGSRWGRGEGAA